MPGPVKINNPTALQPRVLVAPLDWGLGHATRCIPIIKELLNQGCEVIIATDGAQKALLQEEFSSLTFVELPGYRAKYHKKRALTILRLMLSIPKFLIRIKQENAWLKRFAAGERVDLVISDNRYGLAIPGIVCVLVTHQLLIRTPFGGWADRFVQWLNYRMIRRFSRCWVPDIEGEGLAGELSHPRKLPDIPTRYIGWLSRFGGQAEYADAAMTADAGADPGVLVLLSGPEPQRTILERSVLRQAASCGCKLVIVRGLPAGGPGLSAVPPGTIVHDHLPARELENLIRRSALVVARPGYSTIMDLAKLGKRALLIPTPGQTEQEYLGAWLADKGWVTSTTQHAFSLAGALALAASGEGGSLERKEPAQLREELQVALSLARRQQR